MLTSSNEALSFGGLPLGLPLGVVELATIAVTPPKTPLGRAIFLNRPLGLLLLVDAFTFKGFDGAYGSFNHCPLGLDGETTMFGDRGTLGLGGWPCPCLGGAFESHFV